MCARRQAVRHAAYQTTATTIKRQATELLFPEGGDPLELAKAPLANDVFAKARRTQEREGKRGPWV